jgi:hypothetical protein
MGLAMLNLLDESLEEFLRAAVPLPKREIDVSFDAPDKDWSARVSRPTINVYLWDVRRNVSERDLGMQTVHDGNGHPHRRAPLPRINCRYLVTAWTADIRDEHSLLGATLVALLRHSELDREYLQGAYRDVERVPSIEVGTGEGADNSDFWSALGGQLKPGLDVTVTATVDSSLLVAAGPPVLRYSIIATPAGGDPVERLFVGGRSEEQAGTLVSTPHGATEVGPEGTYLVPAEVGDQISVEGVPVHRITGTEVVDITRPTKRKR